MAECPGVLPTRPTIFGLPLDREGVTIVSYKPVQMARLADIARACGVSKATVSLALNGKPGVSLDTRRLVLEVAKKLNYRPHASARSLALQRTDTLGVIVPDLSSPFYAEVIRGLEEEALQHGFFLVLATTMGNPEREELCLRLLQERRVDGILFVTPRGNERLIREIHAGGFPVVVVDREIQSEDGVAEVIVDNYGGARQAVEHLLALGYRRIGYINGIPEIQASQERWRAYRDALQSHGIRISKKWVEVGWFLPEGGYQAMTRLLRISPRLEAVFVACDWMALGAMRAIRERGLRIPQDIAVVGFDDVPLAAQTDPPLTTVRQPMVEMGRAGVQLLAKLIREKKIRQRKVVLPTELVVRSTTPAPSSRAKPLVLVGGEGGTCWRTRRGSRE